VIARAPRIARESIAGPWQPDRGNPFRGVHLNPFLALELRIAIEAARFFGSR